MEKLEQDLFQLCCYQISSFYTIEEDKKIEIWDRYELVFKSFVYEFNRKSLIIVVPGNQDEGIIISTDTQDGLIPKSEKYHIILMVKINNAVMDLNNKIDTQVYITSFPDPVNINTIRNFVSNGLNFMLDVATKSDIEGNRSQIGVNVAKQKLIQFTDNLRDLDNFIQKPDILTSLDTVITESTFKSSDPVELAQKIEEDISLLNALQNCANVWLKSYDVIKDFEPSINFDSVDTELQNWSKITAILEQFICDLKNERLQFSLHILKATNRANLLTNLFHIEILQKKLDFSCACRNFLSIMSTISIQSSDNFDILQYNIDELGSILRRYKLSSYPVKRFIKILEVLTDNLLKHIVSIVPNIFELDYTIFDGTLKNINGIIEKWRNILRENLIQIRQVVRRRDINIDIPFNFDNLIQPFTTVLKTIKVFKLRHHNLIYAFEKLKTTDAFSLFNDLDNCFEKLNTHYIFESNLFSKLQQDYNNILLKIELNLLSNLDSFVGERENGNHLLNELLKYKLLSTYCPMLKSKLKDLEHVLLSSLRREIEHIDEYYLTMDTATDSYQVFNISSVAATIAEHQNLQDRLKMLLHKIELLLGSNWKESIDGKILNNQLISLLERSDLETSTMIWLESVSHDDDDDVETLHIFKISNRESGKLTFSVNFDTRIIPFYEDIKFIRYLGVSLPKSLVRRTSTWNKIGTYARRFDEITRLFFFLVMKAQRFIYTKPLFSPLIADIWHDLTHGLGLSWNDVLEEMANDVNKSQGYLQIIEAKTFNLSNTLEELDSVEKEILNALIEIISSCTVEHTNTKLISKLQGVVDAISPKYMDYKGTLIVHLNDLIVNDVLYKSKQYLKSFPFKNTTVVISFSEDQVKHSPRISSVKHKWVQSISDYLKILGSIELLTTGKEKECFPLGIQFFTTALQSELVDLYSEIEVVYQTACRYVIEWKKRENLWSINEYVLKKEERLPLQIYISILENISNSKAATSLLLREQFFKEYISFTTDEVYTFIMAKYDYWISFLMSYILPLYQDEVKNLDSYVQSQCNVLESNQAQLKTLENVISIGNIIKQTNERKDAWLEELKSFRNIEKVIIKQCKELPADFMFIDQLDSEFSVLLQDLERYSSVIQDNRKLIFKVLSRTEHETALSVENLLQVWKNTKSDLELEPASSVRRIKDIQESCFTLRQAVASMENISDLVFYPLQFSYNLSALLNEINHYMKLWEDFYDIWKIYRSILSQNWDNVEIVNIVSTTGDLRKRLSLLPVSFENNISFKLISNLIVEVQSNIDILRKLKDPSLKFRHWKNLLTTHEIGTSDIGTAESPDFTLENVLSIGLQANETDIHNTLESAHQEYLLEKSLNRIQDFWSKENLESLEHESGILLIKRWDIVERTCKSDLDEITMMKNSHFYHLFSNLCISWQTKLTNLSEILNHWMEVQFQWLDLYGILGKNSSFEKLLPLESSKFRYASTEYQTLLGRFSAAKRLIDIVAVPNFVVHLKNILNSLKSLKVSLSSYLENYRKRFPRFYFISNEDLFKIIGSSSPISALSAFMVKMYGSIVGIIFEGDFIKGVISKEDEKLVLKKQIDTLKYPELCEWLSELDMELKHTIASRIFQCYKNLKSFKEVNIALRKYEFQALLVATNLLFTEKVDRGIQTDNLTLFLDELESVQNHFQQELLSIADILLRRKSKNMLIEIGNYITILQELINRSDSTEMLTLWNNRPRFYLLNSTAAKNELIKIEVHHCDYVLDYDFEYIGIPDRLIHTNVLSNTSAALLASFKQGYGGCLLGPAGTGKTETIKALGHNLGKMVVVFNCDEYYSYSVIFRLLMGISQLGAWACFDEFNRLQENVLSGSAVILESIQSALALKQKEIKLSNTIVSLNVSTGIFITMNPGYLGRSELPENLKKKFREFFYDLFDIHPIISGLLSIKSFSESKMVASQFIKFIDNLRIQCSPQKHYNFSLRIYKKILSHCPNAQENTNALDEVNLLLNSTNEIILPMLHDSDIELFWKMEKETFNAFKPTENACFKELVLKECEKSHLVCSDYFLRKCNQLYDVQRKQQAIIVLGSAGFGKTTIMRTVFNISSALANMEQTVYIIDTKVLSKKDLYGSLSKATLEWKDGVFTQIVRQAYQEWTEHQLKKMIWIVFDCDIDPDYSETINSVLDDNRLLTLPSGERIPIIPNIKLVFETTNIQNATQATLSRCGLVWISEECVNEYSRFFAKLERTMYNLASGDSLSSTFFSHSLSFMKHKVSHSLWNKLSKKRQEFRILMPNSDKKATVQMATTLAFFLNEHHAQLQYINFDEVKSVITLKLCQVFISQFFSNCEVKDSNDHVIFVKNMFGLDSVEDPLTQRFLFEDNRLSIIPIDIPKTKIDASDILSSNLIIPTVENTIKKDILYELLKARCFVVLCGPPGAGKSMIINDLVKKLPNYELISMNFSKETTVQDILNVIHRYTAYISIMEGYILKPTQLNSTLVFFCDEINLPKLDKYGSQPAILFLRQLIEKQGFWNCSDNKWVSIQNMHFIGACNPPHYPGRVPLSPTFLCHSIILYYGYPNSQSLYEIYGCYFDAIFNLLPDLKMYQEDFVNASLFVYDKCKSSFSITDYSHYIITPRELTRLIKSLFHGVINGPSQSGESLLRLWINEQLRIFSDKLTTRADKNVFRDILHNALEKYLPNFEYIDTENIFFCNWFNLEYTDVSKKELLSFIKQRFVVFNEEILESNIILYDELLDNILKIDRTLRQNQGHGMLVGPPRTGKTTLTKFVCWMNNITVVQPQIYRGYTLYQFDDFLREVLIECSINEKKVCMIINEGDMLETAFLERMNTLLANSDIPDLFHNNHYDTLMESITSKLDSLGLNTNNEREKYKWFVDMISANLHIVFTVSDPYDTNKLTSPALFNRCIINWIGKWNLSTMYNVGSVMIHNVPLRFHNHALPTSNSHWIIPVTCTSYSASIVNVFVSFHNSFCEMIKLQEDSPGLFLDSLNSFARKVTIGVEKLEKHQGFISRGLDKLSESVLRIKELNKVLSIKKSELIQKEAEARLTLDELLVQQNEAERKQEATEDIQKILIKQEEETRKQYAAIENDLKDIAPRMAAAEQGVKNIKKQQLTEIRSMHNPPIAVRTVMEATCLVLGYNFDSWRDIQSYIRKDSFMTDIIEHTNKYVIDQKTRHIIEKDYFSLKTFNYQAVQRASRACAPLFEWVCAQVKYSKVLQEVSPLEDEARSVQDSMLKAKARLLAAEEMAEDLKNDVEILKRKYGSLIRDVEVIKTELEGVVGNLERCTLLMSNLTAEKERWLRGTQTYKKESTELAGNCMISSIYETYFGSVDEKQRHHLLKLLFEIMEACLMDFDRSYNYLSDNVTLIDKLTWIECGLQNDDFFIENFHMLINSDDQVPFFYDTTHLVKNVLASLFGKKLITISFLEPGFVKRLENAIKFGTKVIIEDGEFFDPIINNLIAKTFKNVYESKTVQIGGREIDISPNFRLFICTQDTKFKLPSFSRSRLRIINFATTKGNIEMNILRRTLKQEYPEILNEKEELLKMNGGYRIKLQQLEETLLQELNESKGNILDNDVLIDTLESLKEESQEIERKLSFSDTLMYKYDALHGEYSVLGSHSVQIFTILEELSNRHWFFNISIKQFMECFDSIFENDTNTREIKSMDITSRVSELIFLTYQEIYAAFSNNLDNYSKQLLALALYVSYNSQFESEQYKKDLCKLFDLLQKPIDFAAKEDEDILIQWTSDCSSKVQPFIKLLQQGHFNGILDKITSFFKSSIPLSKVVDMHDSMSVVIGNDKGLDGTFMIENIARSKGKTLVTIPLGTRENTESAERAMAKYFNSDTWIFLQNIHLSLEWVGNFLLKEVYNLVNSKDWDENDTSNKRELKIFMSCDLQSNLEVPLTLLQHSYKYVYESVPDVLRLVKELWYADSGHGSNETINTNSSRFLQFKYQLIWLHAVIVSRTRIVPFGFSQKYDFNDCDYSFCLSYLAKVLTNSYNKQVDYAILRRKMIFIVNDIVYGGKMTNTQDKKVLQSVTNRIFLQEENNGETQFVESETEILKDVIVCPPSGLINEELEKVVQPINYFEKWLGISRDKLQVHERDYYKNVVQDAVTILRKHDFM